MKAFRIYGWEEKEESEDNDDAGEEEDDDEIKFMDVSNILENRQARRGLLPIVFRGIDVAPVTHLIS